MEIPSHNPNPDVEYDPDLRITVVGIGRSGAAGHEILDMYR